MMCDWKQVKGSFWIEGYAPDGDSVRFESEGDWPEIDGKVPKINRKRHVQMRLCGIDAPETHFGGHSQPFGEASRDLLLELIGFQNVKWNGEFAESDTDGLLGTVVFKKYGNYKRPIALLFPGHRVIDMNGSDWMKETVNYQMIEKGYAYPTFYDAEIQSVFRGAAKNAFDQKIGLWTKDQSFAASGINPKDPSAVGPCFPKLFRRLVKHRRSESASVFLERLTVDRLQNGETFADHVKVFESSDDRDLLVYVQLRTKPWDLLWK